MTTENIPQVTGSTDNLPIDDAGGPTKDFVEAHNAAKNVIRDAPVVQPRVYRAMLASCHYLFSNGKSAVFVNHFYSTKNAAEIQQLDYEIENGHPHIRKAAEQEAAQYLETPEDTYNNLKAHFFREFLKQYNLDPNTDMGTYQNGPVKPASSSDVAVAAAGGSGQQPQITPVTGSAAALIARLSAPPKN